MAEARVGLEGGEGVEVWVGTVEGAVHAVLGCFGICRGEQEEGESIGELR